MGTVRDFEQKILELEEIVIVVRASPNDEIDDYPYERMAAGNTSISNWIEQRIRPVLGSRDFVIINGEIDLSVGVVSGLAAAVMAVLNVKSGVPGPIAVLAGVGAGLATQHQPGVRVEGHAGRAR